MIIFNTLLFYIIQDQMKNNLLIKNGIIIPGHELEITTSRSGGPGGQHVNKTNSRVTVRWNIKNSHALNDQQKELIISKLQEHLTHDGDLIIHNVETRSQLQNKELALKHLAQKIRDALYVPKERMATRISRSVKETRLNTKTFRGKIKKLRSKKIQDY